MSKYLLGDFKQLPIWKQYNIENKDNYNIDVLVTDALALLDHYYLAFPKYTLHNKQHQYNVLKLIGELLGNEIKQLTSLECTIIILSVIYHDIGMIFSEDELDKIEQEDTFSLFLNTNYKAKLEYQENNLKLNENLAEWYCRWMHAQRVWLFLNDLDKQKWGTISLRDAVGHICESHNNDVNSLINDLIFDSDFLGQADVRFCAILLRLGDILDFDNSRTPKSVYEYLDLDNPKNTNEQISKDEWNKHLCSDGFKITHEDNIIQLKFLAGPEHPQIEKNIQTFLDVIVDELKRCIDIVPKCSKKWRNFRLPSTIDRSNIISHNYKKGDYKLSLDEVQIIKLLTGENLYDTGLIFIRELLQNAIDTCRMREYHEISHGNHTFKVEPIQVTTWIDNNGYSWVRVDDFGMGVNEYIISNHLLKKGNSYYNSDYFKIQKRYYKEKTDKDFTPISRFGIGLLSCFILGDVVEVSSKAVAIPETDSKDEKIRLSIRGLQSQYYLQIEKEKHKPLEMPNKVKNETDFRNAFGSSFAVRISRNKDYLGFEKSVKWRIKNYVTCSPVDIYYNGHKMGVDFDTTLNKPLSIKQFFPFTSEEKKLIESVIQKRINGEIGIQILPIDVTAGSKNNNFKGQVVFLFLKCDDFKDRESFFSWEFNFSLFDYNEKSIRFSKKQKNEETGKEVEKEIKINLEEIFKKAFELEYFDTIFLEELELERKYYRNRLKIIHNGINVPNYTDRYSYNSESKIEFSPTIFSYEMYGYMHNRKHGLFGILSLQDNLIPDLSVARNTIKRLSFSIYSNIFYSTRELNNYLFKEHDYFNYLENVDEHFKLKEIKSDELVLSGLWDEENLIKTELGLLSINKIKNKLKAGEIKISIIRGHGFLQALSRGLVEINFETEYINDDPDRSFFLIKSFKNKFEILDEESEYYPLLFVSFNNDNILSHVDYINKNHWLGEWIFSNKEYLATEFEIYFIILMRYILEANITEVNLILDYFNKVLTKNILPKNKNISKSDFHNLKDPPQLAQE